MRWVFCFIMAACLLNVPGNLYAQTDFSAFGGVSHSASYEACDSGGSAVETGPGTSTQFSLNNGLVVSQSLVITLLDETDGLTPDRFKLEQNYPNPFNPQTMIRFVIPEASDLKLVILNDRGEVVDLLYEGRKAPGQHQITWNASHYATGTYFIRLVSGNIVMVRKCLLIK